MRLGRQAPAHQHQCQARRHAGLVDDDVRRAERRLSALDLHLGRRLPLPRARPVERRDAQHRLEGAARRAGLAQDHLHLQRRAHPQLPDAGQELEGRRAAGPGLHGDPARTLRRRDDRGADSAGPLERPAGHRPGRAAADAGRRTAAPHAVPPRSSERWVSRPITAPPPRRRRRARRGGGVGRADAQPARVRAHGVGRPLVDRAGALDRGARRRPRRLVAA